jgi:hypothetical protein
MTNSYRYSLLGLLSIMMILTVGCDRPIAVGEAPVVTVPSFLSLPATPTPTAFLPLVASATTAPTATTTFTPVPSATVTPTPTLHPMNILALRQRDYPGSEIIIEQDLEPGQTTTATMLPTFRRG